MVILPICLISFLAFSNILYDGDASSLEVLRSVLKSGAKGMDFIVDFGNMVGADYPESPARERLPQVIEEYNRASAPAYFLLGAKDVTGVDIDKLAVKVAIENGKLNGFQYPDYNMIVGNLIDRVSGKYSVVTANIVADAIIMLTPDVKKFLDEDAIYIVSGIIDIREDEVLCCLAENGFTIVNRRSENGWVCLECKL